MELIRKDLDFEIKAVGDPQDRVLEFVGSTAHVDRYGDVIEVEGWDLKNYKKNPVFLWAHDYRQPPVGKALQVAKTDQGLLFHVKFATADEYPFADTIYKLYLGGYLKATSVGFQDLEREPITDKEGKQVGWRFKRQELYELSAVPVPANPNALIMAVQKGVVSPREVEDLTGVPFEVDLNQPERHEPGEPKEIDKPNEDDLQSTLLALAGLLEGLRGKIDALTARIAELRSPHDDRAQLKEVIMETLEEFVTCRAAAPDYYSLALNPGPGPEGGRPAGEPDLKEILNATQNLHRRITKGE
jgi:HK97 family phage prohead protease